MTVWLPACVYFRLVKPTRYVIELRLELWCLTPLSTIFQQYRDGQFYWWRKRDKTIDLVKLVQRKEYKILVRIDSEISESSQKLLVFRELYIS